MKKTIIASAIVASALFAMQAEAVCLTPDQRQEVGSFISDNACLLGGSNEGLDEIASLRTQILKESGVDIRIFTLDKVVDIYSFAEQKIEALYPVTTSRYGRIVLLYVMPASNKIGLYATKSAEQIIPQSLYEQIQVASAKNVDTNTIINILRKMGRALVKSTKATPKKVAINPENMKAPISENTMTEVSSVVVSSKEDDTPPPPSDYYDNEEESGETTLPPEMMEEPKTNMPLLEAPPQYENREKPEPVGGVVEGSEGQSGIIEKTAPKNTTRSIEGANVPNLLNTSALKDAERREEEAIKADIDKHFSKQQTGQAPTEKKLRWGVTCYPMRVALDLGNKNYCRVDELDIQGVAYTGLGLRRGDIVRAIGFPPNRVRGVSMEQFLNYIGNARSGEEVSVVVSRGAQFVELKTVAP